MHTDQIERVHQGTRVVVFAPHAVIRLHAEFERLIAGFFSVRSRKITVLGCDREFFGGCHPHLSRPDEDKASICASCVQSRLHLDRRSTYGKLHPSELLLEEDYKWVEEMLGRIQRLPIGEYRFDDVPLGRYWLFDLVLEKKSLDPLDTSFAEQYLQAARAGLLAYRVGKRVSDALRPDAIIVYSAEYSLNHSFAAAFRDSPVEVYDAIQKGPLHDRGSRFFLRQGDQPQQPHLDERFSGALAKPLSNAEKSIVWRNARNQIKARTAFTYSSGRAGLSGNKVRKKLGVREGSHVVAFLLSSPDEPMAANAAAAYPEGFPADRDYFWISRIIELARQKPNIIFVFRLHPRLAPNRREGRESPDLRRILKILDEETNSVLNVIKNNPGDGIGLYDLAMITDCVLSYRTSSAFELGLLGIPTVQLEPFRDPLHSLGNSSGVELDASTSALGALLDEALSTGPAYEVAKSHARLAATNLVRVTGRISYVDWDWLDRALSTAAKILVKALNRVGIQSVSRYSGIRFLGDRLVRPGKKENDSPTQILRQWQKQVTWEQTSPEEEFRNVLWLRKKLTRILQPMDGSEPFLRWP